VTFQLREDKELNDELVEMIKMREMQTQCPKAGYSHELKDSSWTSAC
jgi:hypothetical protein